jgi:hypothetical protein
MSNTVQIRRREALPGGGFDASGSPRQGKRKVTGQISVTSYAVGGESLPPSAVGLAAIDFISLRHNDQAASTQGKEPRLVNYNLSTQDFYISQITGTGSVGAATGSSHTLQFIAEGDAQDGVELF